MVVVVSAILATTKAVLVSVVLVTISALLETVPRGEFSGTFLKSKRHLPEVFNEVKGSVT